MRPVLFIVLTLSACAPSRAELFDPVDREVRARIGADVAWREGAAVPAATQREIDALLGAPLDADAAARVALMASPALQADLAELGVSGAEVARAGAPPNPELEAELRFPRGDDAGDRDPTIELSLLQDVSGFLTRGPRRRAASASVEAARRRAVADVIGVAFAARAALYAAASDAEAAAALARIAEAARTSAELAVRLHAAGNLTDLRLAQEQALAEQTALDLAAAEERAAASREALAAALGVPPDRALRLARLPALPAAAPPVARLEEDALARSLDLEEERLRVRAAGHEITAGRMGWVPHLGVGAAAAREDHGWEVGPAVSLSIPLFDNGQATRAAGRAHLSAAQARMADRSIAVRRAARVLAARVTAAHARAARLERTLLPLRRRIVEQSLLHYNAMQLGPFELLLARQQEIDAERRALEARRDFWLAAASADALRAGRLTEVTPAAPPAATDLSPSTTSDH